MPRNTYTYVGPWEAVDDGEGVYYYNERTGESSWEKPKPMVRVDMKNAAAADDPGSAETEPPFLELYTE